MEQKKNALPQAMHTRTPRRFHRNNTQYLVTLAIFAALIVVLQFWGSGIKIGITSLSLVLIPVVLGGLLLGIKAGAILGLFFALVTILCGAFGLDAFTLYLLQMHPILTVLTCLVKGTAAGFLPPLIHRLLHHRFPHLSIIVAAACAPLANTSLFMLGMTTMLGTLSAKVGDVVYFLFFTILVCNFLVELAVNLVAAPAIYRIVHAVDQQYRR